MKTKREQIAAIILKFKDATETYIPGSEVEKDHALYSAKLIDDIYNQDIPDEMVELKCQCGEESTGNTTVCCCNLCGLPLPTEPWSFKVPKSSLLPEIPEITEDEIINSIPYPDHISNAQKWKNIGFIRGAKWVIKELKSRIETKQ